jgi:hypothetical protein|tara:strand:- start:211 stop:402 length:192 start_codon:yes stop_codon:yes gene_type:complete
MDMILNLMNGAPSWLNAICLVLTSCTALTAITPSTADDKILNTILKVLNLAAGNFGKNRNKDT